MNSMKKGDRIITKSGIHGKVMELNDKDNTCVIETLAGKLKIERSAISLELSSKLNLPPSKNDYFLCPRERVFFKIVCISFF